MYATSTNTSVMHFRFNRYMVECESKIKSFAQQAVGVF